MSLIVYFSSSQGGKTKDKQTLVKGAKAQLSNWSDVTREVGDCTDCDCTYLERHIKATRSLYEQFDGPLFDDENWSLLLQCFNDS